MASGKKKKEEEQKNSLKIAKGKKFKMTKPVEIPIYETVNGKKKLVGYKVYDADIS